MATHPAVAYCRVLGSGRIAVASLGDGSPLVLLPGWFTHLHERWTHPCTAASRSRLARAHRLIWYDRLGCGLSDRRRFPQSLRGDVDQLLAVMDSMGIERAHLLAHGPGATAATTFAAWYPERVDRLVCCSGFARGAVAATPTWIEALRHLIRVHWALATQTLASLIVPNGSAHDLAWFSAFQQAATTPEAAEELLDHLLGLDTCAFLPDVRAPTLVLHDRDDPLVPLCVGKELAALIPGARLHVLEGRGHDLLIRSTSTVVDTVLAFLARRPFNGDATEGSTREHLTRREKEILRLIAEGNSNKGIARTLGIAPGTVERHATNIYGKMAVRGRAEAATRALQLGLTQYSRPHSTRFDGIPQTCPARNPQHR